MIQADSAGAIVAETEADLLGLILSASPETKVVLVLCAIFSLLSWYLIFAKSVEFRRLKRASDRFHEVVAAGADPAERHPTTVLRDRVRRSRPGQHARARPRTGRCAR